ncbi:hypothetical protein CTheo_7785 [Ceratobasidium theobromae]|uniref:Uncharacterized protein n=1 Tax=Ceratobasidium theobromae TaxID=1582974 RepID=A0A5N5QBL4_9AGAM|nr:hypothetical protein CTheo_7785 [Ceratobasidium theobromae]
MRLLFVLARWHGLAKLRQHSDATLTALDKETSILGDELRAFKAYTATTATYETPQECSARLRRIYAKAKLNADTSSVIPQASKASQQRHRKEFNLNTCKIHFLGDYAESIAHLGTTDSTSTQTGELYHRRVKRRYIRTNKNNPIPQITRKECIENNLHDIRKRLGESETKLPKSLKSRDNEAVNSSDAGRAPYAIAQSQKNPVSLPVWLQDHKSDPALKEFVLRLKNHLLARILGENYQEENGHSDAQIMKLSFQHDRIYRHAKIKINYTSYDVRRSQDIIRPHTPKCFALVPSVEDNNLTTPSHPFWYAKVIGVFHSNVIYGSAPPERMNFLWVRWLGRNLGEPAGWHANRMDQVGYFEDTPSGHAFDFVDPADVIRAAHLIPRFAVGRTLDYLDGTQSIALDDLILGDWDQYYVNRDMLMRYIGFGVGHLGYAPPGDHGISGPNERDTSGMLLAHECTFNADESPVTEDDNNCDSSDDETDGELDEQELDMDEDVDSNSDSDSDGDDYDM